MLLPSVVRTIGASLVYISDCMWENMIVSGNAPLTVNGTSHESFVSRSSFENISVSDIGNIVRIREHTHEDWHIHRVSVLCSDSPLNGVIFCDLNAVNSAYVSDSEIEGCTTTRTATIDNIPKLVTIDGVKFLDNTVHNSTAFISIDGQSLKIRKCSFTFEKRWYHEQHCRAVFFHTPTGALDMSSTRIENCSAVDGSGGSCVLSLGAQTVMIGPDVKTYHICGWEGHDGFVFYGRTDNIVLVGLHNKHSRSYAVSPETYSSSGVFIRLSGTFDFIQHNSTYQGCVTTGRGGGITFDTIQPNSTMTFISTYFVRNGGHIEDETIAQPGGSVTFAPLLAAEGVSVLFTTCRFKSRKHKTDGDDVYAGSGWTDTITPSSFDCSYCSGSETSVFIEGATGTTDTNMIPVKKIKGCPAVPQINAFLFTDYLIHVIAWPSSVLFLATFLLIYMLCHDDLRTRCLRCCRTCPQKVLCWPCRLYESNQEEKKRLNNSKRETHRLDGDEAMGRELQEGKWIRTSDALGYISAARKRYVKTKSEALALVKQKRKRVTRHPATVESEYEILRNWNGTGSSGCEECVENPLLPKEEVDSPHSPSSFLAMKDNLAMVRFFVEGTHVCSRSLELLEWLE